MLNQAGLKPLTDPGELDDEPKRTVLILLGKTSMLRSFDALSFLKNGGAVLIATDSVDQSHDVAATFGVMVPRPLPVAAE